jgi:hypothetical protein
MNCREQSGEHPDSHSEGEDGYYCEATGSSEAPECVPNVLKDAGEEIAE